MLLYGSHDFQVNSIARQLPTPSKSAQPAETKDGPGGFLWVLQLTWLQGCDCRPVIRQDRREFGCRFAKYASFE
jgi:hypothetical protein